MKRIALILVLIALCFSSLVQAQADPLAMAAYFPEGMDFYLSARIDDSVLTDLDDVIAGVQAKIPAELNVPPFSLRDQLATSIASSDAPFTLAELQAAVGDMSAVAVDRLDLLADNDRTNDNEAGYAIAVQITDAATIQGWLEAANTDGQLSPVIVEGDFTVYRNPDGEGTVALGSDALYVVAGGMDWPLELSTTLADDPLFNETMSQLPDSGYGVVAYVNTPQFLSGALQSALSGVDTNIVGPTAAGFTLRDGNTFLIDIAQTPSIVDVTTIASLDPAFTRFIPAEAGLLVHGNDLAGLVNLLLEQADSAASGSDTPSPTEQLEAGVAAIGLDLQDDLLSWMTGDYATFIGIDTAAALSAYMDDPNLSNAAIDSLVKFGVVIEATDPARASKVAGSLSTVLTAAAQSQEDAVTISSEDIGGVSVMVMSIDIPGGSATSLDVLLGSNDEVFFIASRSVAEGILLGDMVSLDQSPVYQAASQYFLPEPNTLFYASDEGMLVSAIVPLALMGPMIGNIFENMVEELEAEGQTSAAPQMIAYQPDDQMQQMLTAVETAIDILGSSSITTAATADGTVLTRFVFSLDI